MGERCKERASYEDILALPEHVIGELLDGELFVSPRPAMRHGRIASVLGVLLGGPFDVSRNGPGGWCIVDEPEIHLGEDVLVPDLAGWKRERMPAWDAAFADVAPDWVCEVLSPSTRRMDRERKLPLYARHGVGHAWLIDLEARTLEIFRREEGGWRALATLGGDGRVRAEPFDAIELDLGALWPTV